MSNSDLQTKISKMSADMDQQFMEVGRLLKEVKNTDFELFKSMAEDTGIGLRKAYYLVEVFEAFDRLNVPAARLRAIGWTKLMVLSKHVDRQNHLQLLQDAENMTTRSLKLKLKGEEPGYNAHSVLMHFSPEQYAKLEASLLRHGATKKGRSLQNKEQALLNLLDRLGEKN